jgi:threonine/homoserine/homoserine lactone efflux protein
VDLLLFLKGTILGVSIAAPVGPIGILCIRHTLNHGRLHGFVSGLGAATADAIYGSLAALGLSVVISQFEPYSLWFELFGAAFLLYIAYRTFRNATNPALSDGRHEAASSGMIKMYATTLILTLMNPMTILSFAGIFAGMQLTVAESSALSLVAGVFLGSLLWWLFLSIAVSMLKKMIQPKHLKLINVGSSLTLAVFGAAILYGAVS